MKVGSFEFNLREFSGSMGDIGTLFPFAIGYIALCGIDPAGLLVIMGLANIITALVYRLPLPIQPMKVIAVVAIAQHWTPSMIYACGFAMGVIWLAFGITGLMVWIAKYTPNSVVRGIQASLGILLTLKAFEMISGEWVLGIILIVVALVLRNNRYAPAAIVLMVFGLAIMFFNEQFREVSPVSFSLPTFTGFKPADIWPVLVLAGFAQIPLTAANAVISTSSLIKTYWPERRVSEKQLSLNMGIMNLISPFFGGLPLCHGAGGLAGQYYFGARTGGTKIIEGIIEICLGLFLASSIAGLLKSFPTAIIGTMLFLVGMELIKFTKDIRVKKDMLPLGATIAFSLLTNMACGFLTGLIIHYVLTLFKRKARV